MKTILFIFSLIITLNLQSQDYIFQPENEQSLISYIEDTKLQFLNDKIKYKINDKDYVIEFKNSKNENMKLEKVDIGFFINYYVENIKIEDLKVYNYVKYGNVIIHINNKLNIINNYNSKILINGKQDDNKISNELLKDNDLLNITSSDEIDYEIDFSTIIGGSGTDLSGSSEKDEMGNLYFSGFTTSNLQSWLKDAYQTNIKGSLDYFVVKLDKNDNVIWGTYVGSPSLDGSCYLDVKGGMIWVAGETHGNGFPLGTKAVQKNHNGGGDFSIFRLDYDGKFQYGTYNGGSGYDTVIDVKIDDNGNAWITGRTCSGGGMYVTSNAVNKSSLGDCDGFLMGFNSDNDCIYASYYGGNNGDLAESICITKNYIIMGGYSNSNSLPNKIGNGTSSNFILGINRINYNVDWSYKYNGGGFTTVQSLHSLSNDSEYFYVSGYSQSNIGKGDVYQNTNKGGIDMFISKFTENGEELLTTMLGGKGYEGRSTTDFQGGGIANDDENNIYVSGYTSSFDFPVSNNAYNSKINGGQDAFLSVLDSELKYLKYSTYFGGSGDETGRDVIWSNNSIYVNGWTKSKNFPVSDNAIQKSISGQYTAFITKFNIPGPSKPCTDNYIEYSTFSDINGLNLVQHAVKYDSTIRLTKPDFYQKGAVWVESPLEVSKGFNCEFTFEISEGDDKEQKDGFLEGADGIAFVIQGVSNNIVGVAGGGIGFENLKNAFAIELDMYNNDEPGYNDPNGNHIAAFSSKSFITPDHSSTDLINQNIDLDEIINDKRRYKFKCIYDEQAKKLFVYVNEVDKGDKLVLQLDDFDISEHLDLISNKAAFVGVTSATGNAIERHEIFSFKFCGGEEFTSVERNLEDNLIYPNPANSYIYINNELINSKIRIYDMIGNLMTFEKNQNKIDISKFKTGIYLIEFESEKGSQIQKFIVE